MKKKFLSKTCITLLFICINLFFNNKIFSQITGFETPPPNDPSCYTNANGCNNWSNWSVQWISYKFPTYLDIYLWNGFTGSWTIIDTDILQTVQSYEWTVPEISFGEYYRVKIVSRNTGAYSFSRVFFTIIPVQQRTVELDNSVLSEQTEINIYPNPCTAMFNVNSTGKEIIAFKIFNSTGSKVYEELLSFGRKELAINVAGLLSGAYLIEFHFNDNSVTKRKIIKE